MPGTRYASLVPYVARQWRRFLLILAVTVAASVITALEPLPLQLLVDYAFRPVQPPAALADALQSIGLAPTPVVLVLAAAAGSLAFFLLSTAIDAVLSWAWMSTGQRMVYDLSAALFHKMQRLSSGFHSRWPVGDSLGRLTQDSWSIYSLTAGMVSPFQGLVTLATIGLFAYYQDAGLALLCFAAAPALAAVSVFFGPALKRRAHLGREAESRLMSFVHQTLESIPAVQAFGTESRNRQKFHAMADDAVNVSQRRALLSGTYGLFTGLLLTAGGGLVLYVGGLKVLAGTISLGQLLTFLRYMQILQTTVGALLQSYGDLKPVQAGMERVIEVLDSPDQVHDKPQAGVLRSRSEGRIRFENVSYGYEPGRPVLKNVSLDVQPGETIAIAGSSGAGKTTLVSLIPRFFDPSEGRVFLDGTDVRDIRLSSLRDQVSVVLQEPFLLPVTIADNIAFGRPGASRLQIEAAAEAANAHDFIRRLPQGYDTLLGQRGASLSGGERQRLSIARALLKDAPVLILDEPTSALDAATEVEVLEAIERLMIGRTTFIIAHRLSTARKADRILIMDLGRIVEAGGHKELIAARGLYHGLYSLQMLGTRPEAAA